LTRFKLLPGEEARSPLSVLLFWKGDWIRSQNLWRRWMVAHNLPGQAAKFVPDALCRLLREPAAARGEEIAQIDGWLKEGIKLDYWFHWTPGGIPVAANGPT